MKKIALCMLVIILFSFSGCTAELHHQIFISAIGVDKDNDGYKLTIRASSLKKEGEEEQYSVKGKTIYDALNNLSLVSGKKQMYANAAFVIFGRAVVDEGLDKGLDFFIRYFKARSTINIYIAESKASDILEAKKDDKLVPAEIIFSSTNNEANKGKTISATALSFIADTDKPGGGAIVPIIENNNGEISCTSSAVFNGYYSNFDLNEDETFGIIAAKSVIANKSIVVTNKEGLNISADITSSSSKISNEFVGGEPEFTLEVNAKAVLASITLSEDKTTYKDIEKLLEEKIKKIVSNVINKSLKNKCDVLHLGNLLYIKETDYWKKVEGSWDDKLPNINVKVKINAVITRIGEEDRPSR